MYQLQQELLGTERVQVFPLRNRRLVILEVDYLPVVYGKLYKYSISEEDNHCVSTLRHRHAKGWVAHQDVPLSKRKMQDKVTK